MPTSLADKTILITGGGGFIANAIVRSLHDTDCRIVRLVRRPQSAYSHLGKAHVTDVIGDATDRRMWQSMDVNIDFVFHLAAQTSTYEANRDPFADFNHNVLPMHLMLDACSKWNTRPVIVFASTVTICGLADRLPVDEKHSDQPITVYDLHKQMAENYLKYYVRLGHVTGAVLRLANVYGPGPRSSRADRGILNQMIGRALSGQALTVYGTGSQLRDYVHVDDVARAFVAAATHADEVNGGHFIIGTGVGHSIAQAMQLIAERVAARTGIIVPVKSVDPPANLSPIEARNFISNSSRFMDATGWRAHHELAQGLDSILESLA